MPPNIVVKIEGGEELLKKLKQMGVDVQGVLKAAALAGAEEIRKPANQDAPGPHVIAEVMDSDKNSATVGIGPDKDHWYYQFMEIGAQAHEITGAPLVFVGEEGLVVTGRLGHPGMAARPFLRPAFDRRKGDAEASVGEKLRRVIEP
jgi:HK97 gp10 family phage protein